jgi:hypothetical protein
MAERTRLNEDDRYDLAQRAAMAVRAARPTGPLVIGGLALVVSVIALLWVSAQRGQALQRLAAEQRRMEEIVSIEQSFATVKTLQSRGASGVNTPLPDLYTRIEQAALSVGLDKPSIPTDSAVPQNGVINRLLTYTVRTAELDKVLRWIELAMERVPGLEVNDIELTIDQIQRNQQQAGQWTVKVVLARWERES